MFSEHKYKILAILIVAGIIHLGISVYNAQQSYKDQQPVIEQLISDTLSEHLGRIRGYQAKFYPAAMILRWPASFEVQGSFAPPIPEEKREIAAKSGKPRDLLRVKLTVEIDLRNNTLEITAMGRGYEIGDNYAIHFDPQPYVGRTYPLIREYQPE
ncbi:hypothetical protein SMSP2_01468 [Limihaloglobus sulfuriphilus]|uniref:Uncharacterized protein n=1 Tax=Limihaloglobus sulfuriphilus TaxID=1851148 RepID=A0A1Q2MEH2_9BACT|nr:hypothetical protein [Limihaloglobus sulfuriphilus]AQQ71103.1 hypothetical protein SMSP2_01468 [Limihaloglobus sulfuriphilus]